MAQGRARCVTKKLLASVIGYCSSCCLALPNGRYHLTSLYSDLHSVDGWQRNIRVKLTNKSI